MSFVVSMLECKVLVQAPIIMHSSDNQDAEFKAFEILSRHMTAKHVSQNSLKKGRSQSCLLVDGPWKDSSVSRQTTYEYSLSSVLDKVAKKEENKASSGEGGGHEPLLVMEAHASSIFK
ncbi:hypothetical protein Dsin_022002 [Dipteronia sinensis]|uniref:Uncharacterized protein n=1 Tax=Dipteronia sinensis TaxID=43782 RepID=A0AAE0A1J6_9ROSI|nr:hypothetical protein Dsin_022002 [Dipteronia sinensis]